VFILVFTASSVKLLEQGFLYAIPGLAALWLLLQIGIADKKYRIIHDQFIFALAVTAFGFIPFHSSYQYQLIGAQAGIGSILLLGIGVLSPLPPATPADEPVDNRPPRT